MSTKVFPELKLEFTELNEYSSDSDTQYDLYTGIVLDPSDNIFKTVSGTFSDKKDFYEKLTARGYVVRKVFEKKVFDWIEKNAKSTLEAYLMFSTAFSKWKGNNLLNSYYTKLLNDIPQLNREKIKGNPNTKTDKLISQESVLIENNKSTYKVEVIPCDRAGNELPDKKPFFLKDVYLQDNSFNSYYKLNEFMLANKQLLNILYLNLGLIPNETRQFQHISKDNPELKGVNFIKLKINEKLLKVIDSDNSQIKNIVTTDSGDNNTIILKPAIIQRIQIANWYKNQFPKSNEDDIATFELNPQTYASRKQNIIKNNLTDLFVNNTDKTNDIALKLIDEIEKLGSNINTFVQANKTYLIKRSNNREQKEKLNEFERDLRLVSNIKADTPEAQALYKKYNSETQEQCINSIKKLQKAYLDSIDIKAFDNNEDSIENKINEIDKQIEDLISQPYNSVEEALTKKQHLEKIRDEYNKVLNNYGEKQKQGLTKEIRQIKAKKISNKVDNALNSITTLLKRQGVKFGGSKANFNKIADLTRQNNELYNLAKSSEFKREPGSYNTFRDLMYNQIKINQELKQQNLDKELPKLKDKLKTLEQDLANVKGSRAKKQFQTMIDNLKRDIEGRENQAALNKARLDNKNESVEVDDGIPVVDEIRPGKHVNYNASQSYANEPVDGVVTNPGAIPTSGHYMYEQDEQWGWTHEQLNQELFDGTKLRPEVREALLRIADKFEHVLGLNLQPVDVYFTGSSANFNYNESSDIDLHLVYNFEEIGINAEILIKYFIAKKQVFNNDYEITIKGIPVEVGVENLNEPIVTSAVYSLTKDSWLLEPEYAQQLLPKPDMKQYYEIVQEIEDSIETRDSKQIGKTWDKLYNIRKASLAKEGEYGKGNALFKKLRNLGYLNRLKNAYYSSASEELSLESLKEIL